MSVLAALAYFVAACAGGVLAFVVVVMLESDMDVGPGPRRRKRP